MTCKHHPPRRVQVVLARINALVANTYYARLHLQREDGSGDVLDIDARPSDAMNLIARYNAPLFVSKDIADVMAVPRGEVDALPMVPGLKETQAQIEKSCQQEVALYRDCTVMKRLQLQLAVKEERFDAATQCAPLHVYLVGHTLLHEYTLLQAPESRSWVHPLASTQTNVLQKWFARHLRRLGTPSGMSTPSCMHQDMHQDMRQGISGEAAAVQAAGRDRADDAVRPRARPRHCPRDRPRGLALRSAPLLLGRAARHSFRCCALTRPSWLCLSGLSVPSAAQLLPRLCRRQLACATSCVHTARSRHSVSCTGTGVGSGYLLSRGERAAAGCDAVAAGCGTPLRLGVTPLRSGVTLLLRPGVKPRRSRVGRPCGCVQALL